MAFLMSQARRSPDHAWIAASLVTLTACSAVELSVFEGPSISDASTTVRDAGADGAIPGDAATRLIDDFEDRDTQTISHGGWWYTVRDDTSSQYFAVEDDARRPDSAFALHTSGSGFTDWGAAIGVDVAGYFAAESFNVLRFLARAETPREVSVHLLDGSGQHFTRSFEISADWQRYFIYLDEMYIVVDGQGVPLDVATLHELQWFFFLPESFDFWLDDVTLIRR
jgi:hypothetical protein